MPKAIPQNWIKVQVLGIPAYANVTRYFVQKGSPGAENPDDYYGYSEIEFDLYDRKGYKAEWLKNKLAKYEKSLAAFELELETLYAESQVEYDDI